METRAHYLLVGGFVLALATFGIGFFLWLATGDVGAGAQRYLIYFEGSVGGLGVGGDVRYRGIRVGTVEKASISPTDPSRVEVVVQIGNDTPIREGDEATLRLQGITGVSYVNVEGAAAGAALLTRKPSDRYPVIPSRASKLEQLFEGAPDLISQGTVAATGIAEIVNEENRRLIHAMLTDVQKLTGSLAAREAQIGRILDSFDKAGGELATATQAVRTTAEKLDLLVGEASAAVVAARDTLRRVDGVVDGDVRALTTDLTATSARLRDVAAEAQALLAENREPLRSFAGEGLPELTQFVLEARLLVAQLSRIAGRLEDEGLGFLLSSQGEGVETDE